MKIKNWIACVEDRGKWKAFFEKAQTLNQEVQRQEEEEEEKEEQGSCNFGAQSNLVLVQNMIIAWTS